ncbi:MAG: dihydropteridine reductase [Clostridia bacterium]|nr:dihydropteridine reductase [Clostridia bacterium]
MNTKQYANKIIKDYSEKQTSKLDELKVLDRKVKKPARIFAYVFGTIASLVLGLGMCFAMKVFENTSTLMMIVGILIGLVGIFAVSINYFIYKKILERRKRKYSQQIIEKSNEILNEN